MQSLTIVIQQLVPLKHCWEKINPLEIAEDPKDRGVYGKLGYG